LDDGALSGDAGASVEARCGACGSGAGVGALVESADTLLSTSAEKTLVACDGSGGAGFGGAIG
jgi:hypothetical protein